MLKKIAILFPGQGAQKVGMGKELYESSKEAKAIFDQADQICANGLLKVIFEGPEDQLIKTAYAQPAILTMSMAAFKAFEAHPKFKSFQIQYAAGLSLGEYSALAVSNSISFEDTLRLVLKRGSLMDEACTQNKGAMAAVIGFDQQKLIEICHQTGAEIANFNSHEQVVITGHANQVAKAIETIKAAGGQKIIPLSVAGAFHSSLMQSAASKFQQSLKEFPIHVGSIKVVTNVNGQAQMSADEIRLNLAKQITASVQWVKSIEFMMSQGVHDFIEIGPGKVLKGLIRRINSEAKVHNIEKPADIDETFPDP